jgi:hypothetical protein
MRKSCTAIVLLIAASAVASAAVVEGTVTDVTPDSITIQQGGLKTLSFTVSNELLTNTAPNYPGGDHSAKFTEVKKGFKVLLECVRDGGRVVCICITLQNPDDAGIVTEVGKDTLKIRSDQGITKTYKVEKDLADNTRADSRYSDGYPSRFGEVKLGCRVEIVCYKKHGDLVICGFDVKQEKPKDE